jgi:hypothetical protein
MTGGAFTYRLLSSYFQYREVELDNYIYHRFPERKGKMAKKIDQTDEFYLDELINAAQAAVIGYEKYLMDRLDYKDLAGIMTNLRELLPFENYERESED